MALFGHNEEMQRILEDIAKISSRIDDMEKSMAVFNKQQAELYQKISDLQAEVDAMKNETSKPHILTTPEPIQPQDLRTSKPDNLTFYLAPPASDGTFANFSPTMQIGKSVYELTTADGINGTFSMIDSDDALATAMISVSQFVKSVCRIDGNTRIYPAHISTIEKGVAVKENGVWKVSKKAFVRFQ